MHGGVPYVTSHGRIGTGLPVNAGLADHHYRRSFVEDSIIARIPLFERMTYEEQDELRSMMSRTTLRRGETLF